MSRRDGSAGAAPSRAGRVREHSRALLHQVFADAGWGCPQILRAMDQISDVYYDRISQIRMDAWSKGRVVPVGDAAACVSLLVAEGAGLPMSRDRLSRTSVS